MSIKHGTVFCLVIISAVNNAKGLIDGSQANTVTDTNDTNNANPGIKSERNGRALHRDCSNNLSPKCLKVHVLSFLEDISSRDELQLPLLPGLSIVKENQTKSVKPEEIAAELSRQFPGKPDEKLNRFLLYRLQDYLDGHSLKYKLLDPQTTQDAMEVARGSGQVVGRGKGGGGFGGGKGGGGALIAAAMMGKGAMAAAALGALALLAGKALMTALMALLLAALVGMKGGGGGGKTTYEIITKPEVSHHHSQSHEEVHEHAHGHHGGYRRAYDPYNSYMPYENAS